MSHTSQPLDGYALSGTDGLHFNTVWIDVHSTPYFSFTLVITGGTVAGTATLQQSNDRQSTGLVDGRIYPLSAQSALGDTLDVVAIPAGTGQQTIVLTTSGVAGVANQFNTGYRWVRLSYTATSSNTTGIANCYFHAKWN